MSGVSQSANLRQKIAAGVMTLTLARPDKHNALNGAMITAFAEALDAADADDSVRILCLRAEGPTFCAGIDLKAAAAIQSQSAIAGHNDVTTLTAAILRLARFPKPTIVLADGPAFAAGVGLLAACDFVLATPRLTVALTQVRNGLIPGFVAPLLAESIGLRAARQVALSGEPMSAERALQLGLVTEIHTASAIDARLSGMIDALQRGAPGALVATKQMMDRQGRAPLNAAAMAEINDMVSAQRADPEAAEGMAAFREKRAPSWYAQDGSDER